MAIQYNYLSDDNNKEKYNTVQKMVITKNINLRRIGRNHLAYTRGQYSIFHLLRNNNNEP